MIAEAREGIRKEVYSEICHDLAAQKVVLPTCAHVSAQPATVIATEAAPPDVAAGSPRSQPPFSSAGFFGSVPQGTIDSNVDRAGDAKRFELSTSTANSRASLRLTRTVSEGGAEIGDDRKWRSFSSYSAALSAPVDKRGDFSNLATLDGFANSSELALRYSKLLVQTTTGSAEDDGTLSRDAAALYAQAGLDPAKQYDLNLIKEQLELRGLLDLYPSFKALYWYPSAKRYIYGATAKIGDETFKYLQPGSTNETSTHETPLALGVFGGMVPGIDKDVFFGAGVEYQRAFEAAKSRTICPVDGEDASIVECTTGSYGQPNETEKLLISLEARKAFGAMGASVKLTHDLRNNDTGVDMPFFLFNDLQSGFSSGLRLGWSNTDQFSFGIFVGAAFSLEGTQ